MARVASDEPESHPDVFNVMQTHLARATTCSTVTMSRPADQPAHRRSQLPNTMPYAEQPSIATANGGSSTPKVELTTPSCAFTANNDDGKLGMAAADPLNSDRMTDEPDCAQLLHHRIGHQHAVRKCERERIAYDAARRR